MYSIPLLQNEGSLPPVEQIGNKARNLMVMNNLGLPVPKGFVIPINSSSFSADQLAEEVALHDLRFPVSIRSGAPVSMPGMLDTILNVGITLSNIENFVDLLGSEVAVYDCYRRLIKGFISTTEYHGDDLHEFENAANIFYIEKDINYQLKLIEIFTGIFNEHSAFTFPQTQEEQLKRAAEAVLNSWYSHRATDYREAENISHDLNTAIIVQEMVFGNKSETSGTGVVFSHNPNNGKPGLYGDFMPTAQGEDVVSGYSIPRPIESMLNDPRFKRCGRELSRHVSKLLREFKRIQDIEFTIEDGTLYILQCRNAKTSPRATVRSALNMVNIGSMNVEEAATMIVDSLPTPPSDSIETDQIFTRIGFGQGVSDGVATGFIATSIRVANEMRSEGLPYIYCASATSPEDTEAMRHSVGVLTASGGRLSHAAILARSMNKVTVVGFESMLINGDSILIDQIQYEKDMLIQIDGNTGSVST